MAEVGKIVQVMGPVVDVEFPPGSLPAVLSALRTTNAAIDELRRRNRRSATSIDDDEGHLQIAALGNMSEAVTASIDVNNALEELPEEFRLPVILRDLCGLDYDQISEVLEIAPGTVRSRIARGRGKLADIIGSLDGVTDVGNQTDARGVQGNDHE